MRPRRLRQPISRRAFIAAAAAVVAAVPGERLAASSGGAGPPLTRAILSTGEQLPAVGLGTWITFNIGDDATAQKQRTDVLRAFFAAGGGMIDSSPMYGSSHAVIGRALRELGQPAGLFAADKVWTPFAGEAQIEQTRRLWGVARFDLLQVHNLLAWETHLPALRAMKTEGKLRYIGITTSEGRRHGEFERVMRQEPLDFAQFSYNVSIAKPRRGFCRSHKTGTSPSS